MAKTEHGELAPKLWQDGKYQEVINYCLMDVKITNEMCLLGWKGELIDSNTGRMIQLPTIEEVIRRDSP